MKTYIFKRGKWYHFRRRIPKDYQIFHSKDSIQVPLKTDSRSIAEQRASNFNQLLESYWDDMALNGENDKVDALKDTVVKAKAKAYFEKQDGVAIPSFKLNMRIDNLESIP